MQTAQLLFWGSAGILAYTYVGYPLLAWLRSKLWHENPRKAFFQPRLSLLVVAHNEARGIRARIENLLALDYPRELLEIVIASDASTDGTAEVAMDFTASGVKVMQFQHFDAALLHLQREIVVILLRFMNPDDVVEQ